MNLYELHRNGVLVRIYRTSKTNAERIRKLLKGGRNWFSSAPSQGQFTSGAGSLPIDRMMI